MTRLVAPLAAAVGVLAAPLSATAAMYSVTIANMAFGAAPPSLKVGDTIEWINADIFEHSATAKDRSFDVTLPPKAHARVVLKHAGQVAFYCRFHPGMTGVLTVAR
jgi:plastocyanin